MVGDSERAGVERFGQSSQELTCPPPGLLVGQDQSGRVDGEAVAHAGFHPALAELVGGRCESFELAQGADRQHRRGVAAQRGELVAGRLGDAAGVGDDVGEEGAVSGVAAAVGDEPDGVGPGLGVAVSAGVEGQVAEGDGVAEPATQLPVDAQPTGELQGQGGFGGGRPFEGHSKVGVGGVDGVHIGVGGCVGSERGQPRRPPPGVHVTLVV